MNQETLKAEIRSACEERQMDLSKPENAFIAAQKTPQGWLVNPFSDLHSAETYAREMSRAGNKEMYVMSANPQHGLQKMVTAKLLFIR